jgi:hypothetical protein
MDRRRWYFVCSCCDAKWFAPVGRMACPRCGSEATSTERFAPPWLKGLKRSRPENNQASSDD